jgi:anti-sigma factor RsiW
MTCRVREHELSAYLDGELPAARRARLEAHLRVCPQCQGELQELSGISHYIRAASQQMRTSQDFDQRVLRAVTSFQVATRTQARRRSLVRPLVAIAIALLALLGMLQHFLFAPPPQPALHPSAVGAVAPPMASAPAAPDDQAPR